jgi:PAS domain S-box-containing protein
MDEPWAEELAAVLLRVARGDFQARMARSGTRDLPDAIRFLVNNTAAEVGTLYDRAESEREFAEGVLQAVPDAIFVLGADGAIGLCNPAASSLLGYRPEALNGRRLCHLVAEYEPTEPLRRMVAALRTNEAPLLLEVAFQHADGEVRPVSLHGHALGPSATPERQSVVVARDMREIHRLMTAEARAASEATRRAVELANANRTLKETQSRLVEAAKAAGVGRLAASVAHEINNPLMAIGLVAGELEFLLAESPDPNPEVLVQLQRMNVGIERCAQVVRGLLAFGQERPLAWRLTDLAAVVRSTLEIIGRRLHGQTGQEVVFEHASPLWVRGDAHRLSQVVMNLLFNAAEAVPEGGRVAMEAGTEPDGVWLAVTDSGPGIPGDIRGRVFEPFFSTKAVQHGAGLGLFTSAGIVQEHGGQLFLEDGPEGGTRAVLRLPRQSPPP